MREKLNNDPKYQIGAVVVLILVAVVLLKSMGGGEETEETAPTEATVSIEGTEATGTATGATPGEAVEGAVEGAVEAAATEASTSTATIPAPPLPHPVSSAYDSGQTVVLVVTGRGRIDKQLVATATGRLDGMPDTAVFLVPAKQVARYGAVTFGVDLQRVPALVVMRPRGLSDSTPQASVIYGFQSAEAAEQAVRDASYDGPEATYNPD